MPVQAPPIQCSDGNPAEYYPAGTYCTSPEEHYLSWQIANPNDDLYYAELYRATDQAGSAYFRVVTGMLCSHTYYTNRIFGAYSNSGSTAAYDRYKVQIRTKNGNVLVAELETDVRVSYRQTCTT